MNCYAPPAVLGYLTHGPWVTPACREFLSDKTLNGVFGLTGKEYAFAFVLTVLIEAPFYFVALKGRLKLDQILVYAIALNLATHPLVLIGLPQFFALAEFPKVTPILLGEIFAPAFEGLMLWRLAGLSWQRAFGFAILANLISWTAGVLV